MTRHTNSLVDITRRKCYEQKIYIAPEEDLVAVFTGNIARYDYHPADSLLVNHILPATKISEEDALDDVNLEEETSDFNGGFVITSIVISFLPGVISLVLVIGFYWIAKKRWK